MSTDWLNGHLTDPSIRLLDCRFYFDDLARGGRLYQESHIPGALYLDWTRDISEARGELQYMAPSAGHLKAAMEALGIGDDTRVIGYDDEGGHYVSRLWLILRRFGHDNVSLLNGGWTKWTAEGRRVSTDDEPRPAKAEFTVDPSRERPEILVTAEEVLRTPDDPDSVLLDVRRWSEYTGDEVRSKQGGRIPGSRWMLWEDNLNWAADRSFRSLDDVRKRYVDAGVMPESKVITYCHGAVRAAHTAFTLNLLGYQRVHVYDGSWEEWGSRDDLPIQSGDPRQSEPA